MIRVTDAFTEQSSSKKKQSAERIYIIEIYIIKKNGTKGNVISTLIPSHLLYVSSILNNRRYTSGKS